METDDNALAMAAGEGDRAAFAALIDRHYDRIFRFAWRLTGAADQAEDLAQDVAILLARRIRQFRGDAKFTTCLYQVVLNAARDRMRRSASRAKARDAFADVDDLRRGEEAERKRSAEWLRVALAELPQDLHETSVLVLDEGLSHAQAGEVLGISEGTISWRLSEIRKRLKAMAAEEGSLT